MSKKIERDNITLIHGDMFDEECFPSLGENSIDAVITDFPYGTLNKKKNVWDKVIDYEKFWEHVKRIGTETTPVISTAQQPFTTALISTNLKDFKYTLVWEKSKATGFLNAKKQPLRAHEDIVVFYKKQCTYNPQKTKGKPYDKGRTRAESDHYGKQVDYKHVKNESGERYPRSVVYFANPSFTTKGEETSGLHPTQKPLDLYDWLIKTYTNEGDTVVDPCMGSATTAISALRTGRKFIGFERDESYYDVAQKRVEDYLSKAEILF